MATHRTGTVVAAVGFFFFVLYLVVRFTSHVMLELSLGWLFVYLGTSKSSPAPESARVG